MIVVGHRGAAGLEPENTLRAFRRALELGVDTVECDVHLTRDGRLAVLHDETVDRTTDGHGPVSGFTLDALRQLNAGLGERVPTLEEVLAEVRGRAGVLVELKGPGTEEAAIEVVRDARMRESVIFTSFHLDRIRHVREYDPTLTTGAIFDQPPPDACAQAMGAGARTMGVRYRHITPTLVQEARDRRLVLRAWNPDTEPEIEQMVDLGVDSIGSNRPDRVIAVLRRRGLR